MRVDSSVDAHRKKMRALYSDVAFDLRVDHLDAGDFARLGIEIQAMHHAVRSHRQLAGLLRRRQRRADAAEVGPGDAAAMADAAVVASSAALVRLRQDRRAADGQDAVVEIFRQRVAEDHLRAIHLHRRQKLAVGQLRQALGLSADAGEFFHVVVPRRDVGVANRPVNGVAFFQVGFEIEIAPAIALASPSKRLSADLASANPRKFRVADIGVRIFDVADEKLARILIASVIDLALNGLLLPPLVAIVPVAILEFPHGHVLDVILLRRDGATRPPGPRRSALFRSALSPPSHR